MYKLELQYDSVSSGRPCFYGIQRMKEKYIQILTKNRALLVDEIDPEGGLINHLESKNILTRRQAVVICRLPDPYKKNEAILDALHRRPDEDFKKFCDVLIECQQKHIVESYLAADGPSSPLPSVEPKSSSVVSSKKDPKDETFPLKKNGVVQNGLIKMVSDSLQIKAVPLEEGKQPLDSLQLIELQDIVVKQCEINFYNSKRHNAYKMNEGCRGKCLIINICETVNQDPRQGAEVDEKILEKLFTELHFEVVLHRNLAAGDIFTVLARILKDPLLSNNQCFVLFVMSHGSIEKYGGAHSEVIFGSDGKLVATSDILELISNCKALIGKPKLVFFQACRGDHYDESDCLPDKPDVEEDEEENTTKTDAVPLGYVNLQDFIVGFPTQSGFRSFRNTKNGSWYLNAIVRVFMEDSHHMDVSAMLRKVNGIVSKWLPKTNDSALQRKGQIASIRDNLTKPYLYLFPGIVKGRHSS